MVKDAITLWEELKSKPSTKAEKHYSAVRNYNKQYNLIRVVLKLYNLLINNKKIK
jgi:hypothetical protein